ncbi:NAD(P)/FAD-dependent oxidoreductase [Arthrobacter halodurans]|uniref:NAD(P)/FAD-dependent oxidoreductase n=1 Tax=Arthrobacter halodurans TaxID=516699 RepID=A0ABV4UR20_9MICC
MQTLAIVGASLAGLSAARAARSQGFAGRLVIVGDEPHRPYDRPPLSKDFLLGAIAEADLSLECDGDDLGAEWLLGSPAVLLRGASSESGLSQGAAHTVVLGNGTTVRADGVVVASGARARTLPALAGLGNVFTLRTLDDARALAPELVPGRRMVVVGGGFVGAEVASAAVARGLRVTLLDRRAEPFAGPLGTEMGAVVAGLHRDHGVDVVPSARIAEFRTDGGRVTGVRFADGRHVGADVVVVGIGAVPNTEWLAGSGVLTDGGVLCDAAGRASLPGVAAVGDCAAWWDDARGSHRRVEHWAGAAERPALAVAALLGGTPPAPKPAYFWSDQHGVRLQFAGHAAGYDRLEIAAGDTAGRSFVALYHRGDDLVAVLGMNQPRLFTKWRRSLPTPVPADLVPVLSVL